MKTVKEFKAKGGVIVNGDESRGYDGSVGKVMRCKAFNETSELDKEVIVEFAWRTNTGVEPEFRGLIDWERDDGKVFVGVEIVDLCWASNITRWRPHLPSIQTEAPEEKAALDKINMLTNDNSPRGRLSNIGNVLHNLSCSTSDEKEQDEFSGYAFTCWDLSQLLSNDEMVSLDTANFASPTPEIPPNADFEGATFEEINPVYTQAMCDAGGKVIAGMMFTTAVGREYCAAMVNDKSVCFEDEDGFLVGMPIGRAKPIKTEKEKRIAAASKNMSDYYFKAAGIKFDSVQFNGYAESLDNAGLLK